MKRRQTDLLIALDRTDRGAEGLTRQIYSQLRSAILGGRLRAGDRIPPSRELAREGDVARLAVAPAYEWFGAGGFVSGRVGAGTFVSGVFDGQPEFEGGGGRAAVGGETQAWSAVSRPVGEHAAPPVPLSSWA